MSPELEAAGGTQPVLVVGAGLVGPLLALALTRHGVPVCLLDTTPPERDPTADKRPLALSQSSMRVLGALGCAGPADLAGAAIRRIHVSEAGAFAKVRMDARDSGVEAFGYVIEGGALAALLQPLLAAQPACEWLRGVQAVRWLEDSHAGLQVGIAGQPDRSLTAPLVVLADSAPAAIADAPVDCEERPYGQVAIACSVVSTRPNAGVAYERFLPGGPLALLPQSEFRSGLVWTLPEDEGRAIGALPEQAFCERLEKDFGGWLGRFREAGPRAVFELALGTARLQAGAQRLVLIGNSALRPHPVAGQGLNLAIRDIAALVECLSAAWARGQDPGSAAVLAAFEKDRARDRTRIKLLTDGLVRGFGSRLMPVRAARRSALLMLSVAPGATRQFARMAMGLWPPLAPLVRGSRP